MAADKDELAAKLELGHHRKRSWRWPIVVVIAVAGLAAWLLMPFGTTAEKAVYVTETVRRADIEVTVSATGTVEPTDLVEVSSELSGKITAVHVDFNDMVDVGTVLAGLDTSRLESQLAVQKASLASAEAKVAVAEANLKGARADYDRGLQLEQRGVETRQVLIEQEVAFERTRAELQSAIAARDLAQANVEMVEVDLAKACICSPVKGVVLERDIDEGQVVAASLSAPKLFTIAEDLTRMELQVDIDEADIGRVDVGQPAFFTVEAYDDREFPAEISELRFASETVDGVVTYKGILALDNSDLLLRPGMTATADIIVASVENALVVPNAALRYTPRQDAEEARESGSGLVGMVLPSRPVRSSAPRTVERSVWVLRDGGPVKVVVETGETDGNLTAILSGDLKEGDLVIEDRIDAQ